MKTISEIKKELEQAESVHREELLSEYEKDSRSGVIALVQKYKKEKEKLEQEKCRIEQMKVYEKKYDHLGYICGIDEAGRGPLILVFLILFFLIP